MGRAFRARVNPFAGRRQALRALVGIAALLVAATCGGDKVSAPTAPTALPETTPAAPVVTLAELTIDPPAVTGGKSSQGTATLSGPSPTSGAVVTLSSDAAPASVPASITIADGATSGTFTITTQAVSAAADATITAVAGGQTQTAALRLTPVATTTPTPTPTPTPAPVAVTLASLTIDPRVFQGGGSSKGTVTLSGAAPATGTVVTLTTSKREARIPASITVVGGATSGTFTFTTGDVSSDMEVLITASAGGQSRSVQIRLLPRALPPSPAPTSGTGSVTIGGKVL